jgi:hypothetical protein
LSVRRNSSLQSAVAGSDLSVLGIDATESLSLAVREVVHGRLGEVKTVTSVVDSENIDSLAVVGHTVASTAL